MEFLLRIIGRIIYYTPFIKEKLHEIDGESFRIVYYHHISDKKSDIYFHNKGISTSDFRRQIEYFKKHFNIISLDESIHIIKNRGSLRNCLAITTDDGFKENYDIVAPILLDKGIKATFFLTWNSIDNKSLIWCDKLMRIINLIEPSEINRIIFNYGQKKLLPVKNHRENLMEWSKRVFPMEDKEILSNDLWELSGFEPEKEFLEMKKPYLTEVQIKELINNGFEIGAHSLSHPLFNKLGFSDIEREVFESQKLIQERFNQPINFFAYPFGVRPSYKDEQKLFELDQGRLKGIIGIKNKSKNNDNPLFWERDKQEADYYLSIFYFYLLPHIRNVLAKIG